MADRPVPGVPLIFDAWSTGGRDRGLRGGATVRREDVRGRPLLPAPRHRDQRRGGGPRAGPDGRPRHDGERPWHRARRLRLPPRRHGLRVRVQHLRDRHRRGGRGRGLRRPCAGRGRAGRRGRRSRPFRPQRRVRRDRAAGRRHGHRRVPRHRPRAARSGPVNARREAWDLLGGAYDVRVLEPSPPAVTTAPWFADDPMAGPYGVRLVTPVDGLGRSWDDVARERPELAGFCADRWLGAWHRLRPLPRAFVPTRRSLHALAEHVVAPARHAANGQIGLRFTRHGFGTPYFGAGHQVRVEEGRLIVDGGAHTPATLGEADANAGEPLGLPPDVYTPATPAAPDTQQPVNHATAVALGVWFGFGWWVLEQLRFEGRSLAPGRVQL